MRSIFTMHKIENVVKTPSQATVYYCFAHELFPKSPKIEFCFVYFFSFWFSSLFF